MSSGPPPSPMPSNCVTFDTGYTLGQVVGAHADWFDAGAGPVVTSGNGLAGSVGLASANDIFTWTARPFNWNSSEVAGVNLQMDFQTDGSGDFDDDRMGWIITNTSVDSTNFFGVQLDTVEDGGIVTYWRDSSCRPGPNTHRASYVGGPGSQYLVSFQCQDHQTDGHLGQDRREPGAARRRRQPDRNPYNRHCRRYQHVVRRLHRHQVLHRCHDVAGLQEL